MRRNWSLGSVPVLQDKPPPTREEVLNQAIRSGPPEGHANRSAREMLVDKMRDASPGGMALYDDLRPTYKDHQVVVRAKI
jgi:hypothetical protein